MGKTQRRIRLIALLLLGICGPAAARSRTHRPWFAGHKRVLLSEPVESRVAYKESSKETLNQEWNQGKKAWNEKVGQQIATQALRYRGTRYRFGGNSKWGFDCSGLVTRVYNDLKFKQVPHMSSALYEKGTPVKMHELRPGDLVFFKNTYRRGISHVGIYAGHNRFVHARNHRYGVTVSPLSDPYYQLHYAGARRLY
jgi:cell wall-associated NlpC family hydrolase